MKKVLMAFFAVAILAAGIIADSTSAQARSRGGAVAAGVIGGLAVGAIIGSQVAPRGQYYSYRAQPGYVTYDGYYQRGPVACPGGYWARRPMYDRYGNLRGYSKPRYFCP